MIEDVQDVEVELKGWGVGGKGEGAKLTLTFAFDVALGDSRPVVRMLAQAFPDLADAMQRGADEADREVELTWPSRYLGGRRFTAEFFGAPSTKRMGGATSTPALRFVDCVLSGRVAAKVTGDAAVITIKVSTPTETCADGDGDELGVRTLARLNHTNLFMDVALQEGDATDAETREEAPKRRQLSIPEVDDKRAGPADRMQAWADEVMSQPWAAGVRATIDGETVVEMGDTSDLDDDGDGFDDEADEGDDCELQALHYEGAAPTPEELDPTGPYEVHITGASPRPDTMTAVMALKKMFGIDNATALKAMNRATKGEGRTIVGHGLSERAALLFVADLVVHDITAEVILPEAHARPTDFTPPTEAALRAWDADGTLDTYLGALSDAEARALHLALTQTATRAGRDEVAKKIRTWLTSRRP